MNFNQKEYILYEYCQNNMHKLKQLCYPKIAKIGGISQMDYDDIYSIALDTLRDSVEKYDDTRNCNFNTYLSANITRKLKSYIRSKNTIKNNGKNTYDEQGEKFFRHNISLDALNENNIDINEILVSNINIEKEILNSIEYSYDDKVSEFLKSLPTTARDIILLRMDNIPSKEIKNRLNLSDYEYKKYLKIARNSENLELFVKTKNYRKDYNNMDIIPIDVTDNYRMDKCPLGTLLDEKRDKKINCSYILQRKAFQWTKKQKNKFLTRIFNNQPIPEIVICEQSISGKKKRHLIDGLQRLSYAAQFRAKGSVIEADGAEFPDIYYREFIFDDNGKLLLDEDGDPIEELKVFNVIGKKFDEFPIFLQERFNKFNINVTTYFNCTDEQIAYHIRNYNNQAGMNNNQYEITNINIQKADLIKNISENHPFFKDRYGKYTEQNEIKGAIDRLVVESIMTINFLYDWKSRPNDIYKYINLHATKDMFEHFEKLLDKLCKIVKKENRNLFNTTNSMIWFAVFDKFTRLGLEDIKFEQFINYFNAEINNLIIDNKNFSIIYKDRHTKDKNVITSKINGIEKLMLEFFQIDKNDYKKNIYDCSFSDKDNETKENMLILEFIRKNVKPNADNEDILLYKEMLIDYTVEVDNSSPLLDAKNQLSLLAIMSYACESDIDLDCWIVDFFDKHNSYIKDQKENYLNMKSDLINYFDTK